MQGPSRPPPRRPRAAQPTFRPHFTLLLLYFFGLFVFFALVLPRILQWRRRPRAVEG